MKEAVAAKRVFKNQKSNVGDMQTSNEMPHFNVLVRQDQRFRQIPNRPGDKCVVFTGCYAFEPADDVPLHAKLITMEKDISDCAYKCYAMGWNDLQCSYYKEPGCAGFDW